MESDANANPQGSENQSPINIESAFDDYLKRQATPGGDEGEGQPAEGAEKGQPEGQAESDTSETKTDEQRFKVKVNGEEREVPLSELLKGYSLESDYRVKTSQLAEQSRAAQAQAQQAQAMQQQYGQMLNVYSQQLAQTQPRPPDPSLIDQDPVGYLRQQQAYSTWQQQMTQVQTEQQALSQWQQQQQAQIVTKVQAEQAELLQKAIPEWSDEAKRGEGKKALLDYLIKQGIPKTEIAAVMDHKAFLIAEKARRYDEMMGKQKSVAEKVEKLPPKSPQRPGSGVSANDGRTRAMQDLKKTGSIDSAAAAFAAMLGG